MNIKIGEGLDVHRLVSGRRLVLGGVNIEYDKGLDGHSDADVLIHAVIDALLGACAKGDIGKMFPDSDAKYKDADSIKLLHKVGRSIIESGYRVGNIDCTIAAQAPKLAPYTDEMRANIAAALGILKDDVSVKATTTEHLGFEGRGEGISAQAVCLLFS